MDITSFSQARRTFTLLAFFAAFTCSALAQQQVSSGQLAHLDNSDLRQMQNLLLRWQQDTFTRDLQSNEQWLQSVRVQESGTILYKIRPIGDTTGPWTITYVIPITSIDHIENDYSNHTIRFFTKENAILVYEQDYPNPAQRLSTIEFYCLLTKVRNLAGQLENAVKHYQQNADRTKQH